MTDHDPAAISHETLNGGRLRISFPAIPGERHSSWNDILETGIDDLLSSIDLARAWLGAEAVQSLLPRLPRQPLVTGDHQDSRRTWSCCIGWGFCAGDYDEQREISVCDTSVHTWNHAHMYGLTLSEDRWEGNLETFLDPGNPERSKFGPCLDRIDTEIHRRLRQQGTSEDL
jgi:hypothetical protein